MTVRISSLCLFAFLAGCEQGTLETTLAEVEIDNQDTTDVEGANEAEASVEPLTIDFGSTLEDSWYAVNDTVMGGVSEGIVEYSNDSMVFEGVVSTANNGGFASVRSISDSMDLRDFERVVIRMKNEGQPFTLVLADTPNWWEGQFRYDLEVEGSGWTEIAIDLNEFEFFDFSTGYPRPTGEMMKRRDRKEILYLEFMSALFEDGDFLLEVDHITFE